MKTPSRARITGRFLVACALAAPLVSLRADVSAGDPMVLDPVVVSATRTPVPINQIGSAVTVITPEDVARRQATSLSAALNGAAGTPIQTGATGGFTSLFIRGAASTQSLFLIDGIRASDSNALYGNFVGGAAPMSTDRIEVVRGPQSTIYGADAIGGVVTIGMQRGSGTPSEAVFAEAGSFNTFRSTLSAQGETGANAYNASVTGLTTQNDRENNDFESITAAARVDHRINDAVIVGGTVRAVRGVYGSPGANVGFGANDPDNEERETNALATVFAEFTPSNDWSGRVTFGGQNRELVSEDPSAPSKARTTTHRGVLDAQASYSGVDTHRITFGGTGEWQHFNNDGFGSPSAHTLDGAVFVQDEWTPVDRLFFTAGVRHDQLDSFGGHTTGRATAAWQAVPERLKLRGSYGTGFRAPSFLELYGFAPDPFFGDYIGNPDLDPEEARGWDLGLDYSLPNQRGTISVTYFRNDYKNLINGFVFVPGAPAFFTSENVGKALSKGVEFSAELWLTRTLLASGTYTYTDALDRSADQRLLRRPRHAATIDIWNDFGGGFSAGAGATFAADSEDIDSASPFGARTEGEDYVVARIYAAWAVNDRLTLKARVENLFDEDYAAVNGFPSLGIGAFAGAEWRF
ncbi:MAG: btuB 1 [Rariglobus sp.]|jgi:vitamin B12 transporter|nr:btuB 1 [Rariglobus sp.]